MYSISFSSGLSLSLSLSVRPAGRVLDSARGFIPPELLGLLLQDFQSRLAVPVDLVSLALADRFLAVLAVGGGGPPSPPGPGDRQVHLRHTHEDAPPVVISRPLVGPHDDLAVDDDLEGSGTAGLSVHRLAPATIFSCDLDALDEDVRVLVLDPLCDGKVIGLQTGTWRVPNRHGNALFLRNTRWCYDTKRNNEKGGGNMRTQIILSSGNNSEQLEAGGKKKSPVQFQLPTCIVRYFSKFNGGAGDSATSSNSRLLVGGNGNDDDDDDEAPTSSSSSLSLTVPESSILLLTFSSADPLMIASEDKMVDFCCEKASVRRRWKDASFGCSRVRKAKDCCCCCCRVIRWGTVNDEQPVEQQASTKTHNILTTCEDDNDDLSDGAILAFDDTRAIPSLRWQLHSARRGDRFVDPRDEDEDIEDKVAIIVTDVSFCFLCFTD